MTSSPSSSSNTYMAVPWQAVARINQFLQKACGTNPQELLSYTFDPTSKRATLHLFNRRFQFVDEAENVAREGVYRAALCRNILDTIVEHRYLATAKAIVPKERERLRMVQEMVGPYSDMTTLGEMPLPKSRTSGASSVHSSPSMSQLSIKEGSMYTARDFPSDDLDPMSPHSKLNYANSGQGDIATTGPVPAIPFSHDTSIDTLHSSSTSTPTSASTYPPDTAISSIFSVPDNRGATRSVTPSSSTSTAAPAAEVGINKTAVASYPWSSKAMATLSSSNDNQGKNQLKPGYQSKSPEADLAKWRRLARDPAPTSAYERVEIFATCHFGQCRAPAVYMPFVDFRYHGDLAVLQLVKSDSHIYTKRIDPNSPNFGNDHFYKEETAIQAITQDFFRSSLKRKAPKQQYRELIDKVIRKFSNISTLAVNRPDRESTVPSPTRSRTGGGTVQIAGNAERKKAKAASSSEAIKIAGSALGKEGLLVSGGAEGTFSPMGDPGMPSLAMLPNPPESRSSSLGLDAMLPTGPAAMTRSPNGRSSPLPPPLASGPVSAFIPERPSDSSSIPTGPRQAMDISEVIKSKPAGLPDRPKSMRGLSLPTDGMQKVYLNGKIVLMTKEAAASANNNAGTAESASDAMGRARYGSSPPTGPRQLALNSREEELRRRARESSRVSEGEGRTRSVSIRGSADLRGRGRSQELGADPHERYNERSRLRTRSRSPSRERVGERRRSRRSHDEENRRRDRQREAEWDMDGRKRSRSRSVSRERHRRRRSYSERNDRSTPAPSRKRSRSEERMDASDDAGRRRKDRKGSASSSDEKNREKRPRRAGREEESTKHGEGLDASSSLLQLIFELAQGKLQYSMAVSAATELKLPYALEKTALETLQAVHEASPSHLLRKANIEEGTDVVMLPRSWVEETRQLLLSA